MERLVCVELKKVHILLFPLIYVSYDSEGIMMQGSKEDRGILATMVIPENLLIVMNVNNLWYYRNSSINHI